jgi:hypothetical protein
MVWYSVAVVIAFLVDVFAVRWKSADKDLEILLLRQQLLVLERKLGQRARVIAINAIQGEGKLKRRVLFNRMALIIWSDPRW